MDNVTLEHGLLDWVALLMLFFAAMTTLLVFLWAHEIPFKLAVRRAHPHVDAIRAACWISIFTGGLMWPLTLLWSLAGQPRVDVHMMGAARSEPGPAAGAEPATVAAGEEEEEAS